MSVVLLALGVVVVFVLAFLIDISINMRRVDSNLKKMINNYDKVHGTHKA